MLPVRLRIGGACWAVCLAVAGLSFLDSAWWRVNPVLGTANQLGGPVLWSVFFGAAALGLLAAAVHGSWRWWRIAAPSALGVAVCTTGAILWEHFVGGTPLSPLGVATFLWWTAGPAAMVLSPTRGPTNGGG